MTVNELNRDQICQLKQQMLVERMDSQGESPSWGELADADILISDAEVMAEFCSVEFVNEDFWS